MIGHKNKQTPKQTPEKTNKQTANSDYNFEKYSGIWNLLGINLKLSSCFLTLIKINYKNNIYTLGDFFPFLGFATSSSALLFRPPGRPSFFSSSAETSRSVSTLKNNQEYVVIIKTFHPIFYMTLKAFHSSLFYDRTPSCIISGYILYM